MINLPLLISLSLIILVSYVFINLNISTVLGYLLCGMIVGENGLQYFNSNDAFLFGWSEMGVVFLLFVIGLELSYKRIAIMKKYIFVFGLLQFFITFSILFIFFSYFNTFKIAFILGAGFAISSTSVVLQILKEKEMQREQVGKISLGILLFQDMVVVPILVIMPLLNSNDLSFYYMLYSILTAIFNCFLALVTILILSHILRIGIRAITYSNISVNHELFTLLVFLIIFSAVFVSDGLGLQSTLGGFVAGVLLSENEFKHRIEKSIIAIKGILLGLFFLTVGMKLNLDFVYKHLSVIVFSSLFLMIFKGIIIFILCFYLMKYSASISFKASVLLSQGSEFGFIIFNTAFKTQMISAYLEQILLTSIVLTMAFTPIVFSFVLFLINRYAKQINTIDSIALDNNDLQDHVIILGYGVTGKTIAEHLSANDIDFLVLESDANVVSINKHKVRIYKANGANIEAMKAAGILRCKILVITFENDITIEKLLYSLHNIVEEKYFSIFVRSQKNMFKDKLASLGADSVVFDEVESGHRLSENILQKYQLHSKILKEEE